MLYRYKKVITKLTTIALPEPEDEKYKPNEIGTIDGWTYVHIKNPKKLPPIPKEIKLEKVKMDSDLHEKLKKHSPHVRLINKRVVERIRKKYSIDDELECLREGILDPTCKKFTMYNAYVEKARKWGRKVKKDIGVEIE